MKIKGIIFDKDGTLMDFAAFWIPVAENAVQYILDIVGADNSLAGEMLNSIGSYEGIRGVLCSGTYEQIADKFYGILSEHNIEIDKQELNTITYQAFHNSIECGEIIPTCDNIKEVFSNLKESGRIIALVTTDDEYITQKCLEMLEIYSFFDVIYSDDGIHPSKPNPYYISRLCEEKGLSTDELIMVGDTMTDMKFAENGGIMSIGVAKKEKDREVIMKSADYVIDDISKLNSILR